MDDDAVGRGHAFLGAMARIIIMAMRSVHMQASTFNAAHDYYSTTLRPLLRRPVDARVVGVDVYATVGPGR